MIEGLDHVQLAMPRGGEGRVRAYFGGMLGLEDLALRLGEGGHPVRWGGELAPRRRFYSEDPFGNRMEYLEPVS